MREFKVFVRATNDIADAISGSTMMTATTMTVAAATAVSGTGGDLSTTSAGWTEVLHSGLRNDSESECFPLQYPIRQVLLDEQDEDQWSSSLVSYRACTGSSHHTPWWLLLLIGTIKELSIDTRAICENPPAGGLGQQLQLLHLACGVEGDK